MPLSSYHCNVVAISVEGVNDSGEAVDECGKGVGGDGEVVDVSVEVVGGSGEVFTKVLRYDEQRQKKSPITQSEITEPKFCDTMNSSRITCRRPKRST